MQQTINHIQKQRDQAYEQLMWSLAPSDWWPLTDFAGAGTGGPPLSVRRNVVIQPARGALNSGSNNPPFNWQSQERPLLRGFPSSKGFRFFSSGQGRLLFSTSPFAVIGDNPGATFAFWFQDHSATPSGARIYNQGVSTEASWFQWQGANELRFAHSGAQGGARLQWFTDYTNEPYFFVFTRASNNALAFYGNGVLRDTSTWVSSDTSTNSKIGQSITNASASGNFTYQHVATWPRVLSANEVMALWKVGTQT